MQIEVLHLNKDSDLTTSEAPFARLSKAYQDDLQSFKPN